MDCGRIYYRSYIIKVCIKEQKGVDIVQIMCYCIDVTKKANKKRRTKYEKHG